MPTGKARIVLAGSTLFGCLFWGSSAFAQVNPGDPSQYPPGQYPPNQYPNQYPARLPGGVPLNLPVPQIKLPQRHPKDEKKDGSTDEIKITLASVDGVLRKLGEKDLLLETPKDRVLKFRLLAKTQFRDTKGEVVRDSLLHPGDRLNVQVNTDDPETAIKVVFVRAGTSAEREASAASVTDAKIVTPSIEDLKKPHTASAREETSESSSEAGASTAPTSGVNGGFLSDQVIADARQAAASFTSELPNFLVQQATTRYRSFTGKWNWEPVDVVTADVAVVDGKEDYRNVLVNGRPPQGGAVEKTGAWSSGEFSTTLTDILDPSTHAAFEAHGSDTIGGRAAWLYNVSVTHQNSHWIIVSESGGKYNPAYTGSIWIDKETRRVLRIEQRAGDLPRDFTYTKAESIVTYGFVQIDGKEHLLPVTSENSACVSGTNNCVRNVIAFRNYRKFSAESDIKYEKFASQ